MVDGAMIAVDVKIDSMTHHTEFNKGCLTIGLWQNGTKTLLDS
jgi:hypothetical protein